MECRVVTRALGGQRDGFQRGLDPREDAVGQFFWDLDVHARDVVAFSVGVAGQDGDSLQFRDRSGAETAQRARKSYFIGDARGVLVVVLIGVVVRCSFDFVHGTPVQIRQLQTSQPA